MLTDLLRRAPDERPAPALKHWDDRFGVLMTDPKARRGLIIIDRETGELSAFRLIEDLLNAGWAVD